MVPDLPSSQEGGPLLLVGAGHVRRSNRIEVHRQPPAAQDVSVRGGGFRMMLEPVVSAGQKRRLRRIESHVNGESTAVQGRGLLSQLLMLIEIAACSSPILQCPEFHYVPGLKERLDSPPNLAGGFVRPFQ